MARRFSQVDWFSTDESKVFKNKISMKLITDVFAIIGVCAVVIICFVWAARLVIGYIERKDP